MKRRLLFLLLTLSVWGHLTQSAHADDYDLVVVEATPGGIAMAVRAAREGMRVLLVNRTAHLGGILSNGLGVWDTLHEGKRSPLYDEVRQSLFDHYRTTYGETSPQYKAALPGKSGHTNGRFEPKVAEKILTDLVKAETNIQVLTGYVPLSLEREGRLIRTLTVQAFQGKATQRITASVFADCTYEGDLLPLAKAAYRVGREARSEYDEPHAGLIYMRASKEPPTAEISEMAAQHDRLNLRKFPGFQQRVDPASTGAGDSNVQAFNYRTILTSDPANRVPVEKPEHYDPKALAALEFGSIVSPLPNNKVGWNRPQLIGPHQAYVEGDWATRLRVMDQHWQATQGLLYYLQNDPAVPEERRRFFSAYGLARDEFGDHGHRPLEFYVREGRRLNGRSVITQHDLMLAPGAHRAPLHTDSIAFAEWYMDTHACTEGKTEGSLDEGKMMLHHETFPAQIPYRALLPVEVDNLLVPICLSATHVAWGAIRLEPAWMQIGESAGFACAQAKREGKSPADLDASKLVLTLAQRRSMTTFFNDLDMGRKDEAVTAALYWAGRGWFQDYDARLNEPVKESTARVWLSRLSVPLDDAQAEQTLRAVMQAESQDSPLLTRGLWNILREGSVKTSSAWQGSEVTRGEVLRDLFTDLVNPKQ